MVTELQIVFNGVVSAGINCVISNLRQIWDELGVSKGLVIPHVGIKTSCINQEGLNIHTNHFHQLCGMMYVGEYVSQDSSKNRQRQRVYLVLLSTQSSCCGNLFQLCRCLFSKDPLQQDKDVCRLWGSLQQYCQTTVPESMFFSLVRSILNNP